MSSSKPETVKSVPMGRYSQTGLSLLQLLLVLGVLGVVVTIIANQFI